MANKEAVDDDTFWLILAGVGAVFLFGGGIVAWFVMATEQASRWLVGAGILVPAEQAAVAVIGGAGWIQAALPVSPSRWSWQWCWQSGW